jgi:hypothetical protein
MFIVQCVDGGRHDFLSASIRSPDSGSPGIFTPLFGQPGAVVPNWTVPPYTRQSVSGGLSTMADVTGPAPFVAIAPCRVVDTRGPVGPYGGPPLAANVTRAFNIETGPCTGIGALPAAFSLNFGAILPPADGFLTAGRSEQRSRPSPS